MHSVNARERVEHPLDLQRVCAPPKMCAIMCIVHQLVVGSQVEEVEEDRAGPVRASTLESVFCHAVGDKGFLCVLCARMISMISSHTCIQATQT